MNTNAEMTQASMATIFGGLSFELSGSSINYVNLIIWLYDIQSE